ncbi:MAG: ComEC/Rec2 family competence protein [Spirochaetales bacterium]|nr:ComEC/Rec2 family competence protein [Spirochaetales bacterium]
MKPFRIIVRPDIDLPLFAVTLFAAYYYSSLALFIFLLIPLLYRYKLSLLIVIFGLVCGLLLGGSVSVEQWRSSSGLAPELVRYITVRLEEDSFISSKGRIIIKGELLSVSGLFDTRCSAEGSVLVLGQEDGVVFHTGEIAGLSCSLGKMDDSPDLSYIAFARGELERIGWMSSFWKWRYGLIKAFDRRTEAMNHSVAALFLALYRGNSDYLPIGLKENFRLSGVPHLLALSGFHVAIIVLLLTGLITPLTGRKTATILAVPPLFLYMIFAGSGPSLIRAVLMFFLAVLFRLRGRRITLFQLLLVTACLQLFLRPAEGWSLSYQLSYLALAGLIRLGKRFELSMPAVVPSFITVPLSASLGAHISTALLLIVQFGQITPAGIISSLAVTPLVVLFMWFSLGAYVAGLVEVPLEVSRLLNGLCIFLYDSIDSAVSLFARFPPVDFSRKWEGLLYLSIMLLIVLWLYRPFWRPYGRREKSQFKLRFPVRNKSPSRIDGIGTAEEMESEFSH